MSAFRIFNIATAAAGMVLFGAVFLLVWLAPADLDSRVRDFALAHVQDRVETRLQQDDVTSVLDSAEGLAGRFSSRLEERVSSARDALDAGVPELVAEIVSQICEYDCERSREVESQVREMFERSIVRHSMALDRLQDFVEVEYSRVVSELRRDIGIFSGTNVIVLAMVLLLGLFRGRASAHLLPFATILLVATLLAASWYVLGQNWLLTILFSDYWGWGYTTLLGVIAVFLGDIAFFQARLTSAVLNAIGGALGNAFTLVPC